MNEAEYKKKEALNKQIDNIFPVKTKEDTDKLENLLDQLEELDPSFRANYDSKKLFKEFNEIYRPISDIQIRLSEIRVEITKLLKEQKELLKEKDRLITKKELYKIQKRRKQSI